MNNDRSLRRDSPIGGRPRRFIVRRDGAASHNTPEAIRGLTISLTVLRLTSSRRAKSTREIGCAARTIRNMVRAVSPDTLDGSAGTRSGSSGVVSGSNSSSLYLTVLLPALRKLETLGVDEMPARILF